MKKLLKILLIVLGSLVVLIGAGALYVNIDGIPRYETKKIDLHIVVTPERVTHGRKIVSMLCANCHINPETGYLTGHKLMDIPPAFGTIFSRNITQDPKYGIGGWTDGEIAYLLRTGIKKDGNYAPPYMVKLPDAPDEDIASIIAFLRSDDSMVRAQPVQDSVERPSFLVKFLSHVAFKPLEYPTKPIPQVDLHNTLAYGKYLMTGLIGCFACHSADFKTIDVLHPDKSEGYMGGNNEMLDLGGKKIYSANITMDKETGIGTWTKDEFIRAVRDGFAPGNRPLRYPMDRFSELSDQEIGTMWDYLQTVPVIHKQRRVAEVYALTGQGVTDGQRIFYKYSCFSCHGTTGIGTCDLRKGYIHYPTTDSLTAWIKHPSHFVPGTKMPTWDGVIKESEYPALCEYVRFLGQQAAKPMAAR